MAIISLVAVLDEAGGIGINNQLLCHLPADLQYFKALTMGKPILMGRRTFESIGKPLPGRLNIVLSRSSLFIEGALVVDSLEKGINQVAEKPELMIIGGASLYAQALEIAQRLYITRIHHQFVADAFFPEIDEFEWSCCNKIFRQHDDRNLFDMTFYTFERNK